MGVLLGQLEFGPEVITALAKVSNPVAWTGLTLVVLFLIYRAVLRMRIFAELRTSQTYLLVNRIVILLFVLALVAMLMGFGAYVYNVRLGKQNVGDGSNDPILGTSPAEGRRPESPETARVSSELEDIVICQTGERRETLATMESRFASLQDGMIPGDFFIGNGALPADADRDEQIGDGELVLGKQWTGTRTIPNASLDDILRYDRHGPASVVLEGLNYHGIEVVLIGDLTDQGDPPTPMQQETLRSLVRFLMTAYGIPANRVWALGQKQPGHPPDGVTGHFSIADFRSSLRAAPSDTEVRGGHR